MLRVILLLTGASLLPGNARPFSSIHLVTSCFNYWASIQNAGLQTMHFDSSTCVNTEADVGAAVDKIMQRAAREDRTAIVGSTQRAPGDQFYVKALRAGIAVFFIEDGVNVTKWGLDSKHVLMMQFRPNNADGAAFTGANLCRVSNGLDQRVAVIYPPQESLDIRIDIAVKHFKIKCPGIGFQILQSLTGDWSADNAYRQFKAVFTKFDSISAVIAANDMMAIGVYRAAQEVLPPEKARALYITGFDNSAPGQLALAAKHLISTVDQMMGIPHKGVWSSIARVVDAVQSEGLNSTQAVAKYFEQSNTQSVQETSFLFQTSVLLAASDGEAYVTQQLLPRYQPTVRAIPTTGYGPTVVSLNVNSLKVEAFFLDANSFSCNFWLDVRWVDKRLVWDLAQYNGSLQLPAESLWRPETYFDNIQSVHHVIYESAVVVDYNGDMHWRRHIAGLFDCDMKLNHYPFNTDTCAVKVGVSSKKGQVALVSSKDMTLEITDTPQEYIIPDVLDVEVETDVNSLDEVAFFPFTAVHSASYTIYSVWLPAIVLTLISFGQYFLHACGERVGLGITAILASLVLQADSRVSRVFTWQETFLNISVAFQFIALSITIRVYRASSSAGRRSQHRRMDSIWTATLKTKGFVSAVNELSYELSCAYVGCDESPLEDKLGRRVTVPAFWFVTAALPFCPGQWADPYLPSHPDYGFKSTLFWCAAAGLMSYVIAAITVVMNQVATCSRTGPDTSDEMDAASDDSGSFHKSADTDQIELYEAEAVPVTLVTPKASIETPRHIRVWL